MGIASRTAVTSYFVKTSLCNFLSNMHDDRYSINHHLQYSQSAFISFNGFAYYCSNSHTTPFFTKIGLEISKHDIIMASDDVVARGQQKKGLRLNPRVIR